MNESDLRWIENTLAGLADRGRVWVSSGGGFTLQDPFIRTGAGCDFELCGTRRRRMGADRVKSGVSFPVGKVLFAGKNILALQDIWGRILTVRPARSEEV